MRLFPLALASLTSLSLCLACSDDGDGGNQTAGGDTSESGGGNSSPSGDGGTSSGADGGSSSDGGTAAGSSSSGSSTSTGGASTDGGSTDPTELDGDGSAVIDLEVTMGEHTAKLTNCTWTAGTAQQIRQSTWQTPDFNGETEGLLECLGNESGATTAVFGVKLSFLVSGVGTHQTSDLRIDYPTTGPTGNAAIELSHSDGTQVSTAGTRTAVDETGTFTLTSFDAATGLASGTVDLAMSFGDADFTLEGSFEADLFDCTGQAGCDGSGD